MGAVPVPLPGSQRARQALAPDRLYG